MAVSGCSLLAVDWIDHSQGLFLLDVKWRLFLDPSCPVVGVSGLFAADQWLHRILPWTLVVDQSNASPRVDGYYIDHHQRFQHRIGYSSEYAIAVFQTARSFQNPLHLAKTDRGNLIELYRFEIVEDKWKEFAARAEERFKNFGAAMIRRDQSNARSIVMAGSLRTASSCYRAAMSKLFSPRMDTRRLRNPSWRCHRLSKQLERFSIQV